MRTHTFHLFDHAPASSLRSLAAVGLHAAVQRLRRASSAVAITVLTAAAAAVFTVLAVLLKR